MNGGVAPLDDTRRTRQGIAFGVAAGALWGLVFLAPELAGAFTPLELATGRYLAYGALSVVLLAPRWRTIAPRLTRRDWLSLTWLGLAGNTLYYILLSAAVQNGGIAMTSLIVGFLPVSITVLGGRDSGAVPLRALAPSLLLCASGVLCIGWDALAGASGNPARDSLFGLICACGALAVWTAYAIGNSRCLARLDHVSEHDWNLLTGIVTGAQAVALVPLALRAGSQDHDASAWMTFAGISLAVAFIGSIAGNALWNRMCRLLPLTLSGQMIVFETLFALLYGFAWEQRLPTALEAAAFVLMILGVTTCLAAHQPGRAASSGTAAR